MTADQILLSRPGAVTAFGDLYREAQAQLFRRNVLVAAAVYMAFICWDVIVAPMSVTDTVGIRLLFVGIAAVLFIASGLQSFRRWYNWCYVALIGSVGISIAVILWLVPQGFAIGVTGVALTIAASSAMFRADGWATATAGAIATLGTIALMMVHGEPEYLVRGHAIFLVAAVGIAVLHSVQAERSAYEVFQAQERLEGEKSRSQALLRDITTMRAERLTWLENLARFLRHELSNQIVAVSTSIDLANRDGSPFGSRTYLERAQRSLNRMRGLVSSATEATSLESALAVEEMERVDWSAVVVDRVSAFQELHPSRHITLKLRPRLLVDGNEDRLAQLLDKLLNNAREHSPEDAEIRVELGQVDGDWLELTVDNDGDPLPNDKDRMFEAFVSSQGRPENLGLGLFVAQSIARNHRGQITAEDLSKGRGARFLVRLPEGGMDPRAGLEEDSSGLPALGAAPGSEVVPRD